MNINDALKAALAHMGAVSVCGKDGMKHQINAIELVKAVVNAIDNAEKEGANHANNHNQQREAV